MTTELSILAWTVVLAAVQIILFDLVRTRQYGLKWNVSPRDGEREPLSPLGQRLCKAQNNLFETLPLFAIAVLVVHALGRETANTALGAQLYFWARIVYVPLYAFGVAYLRSAVWVVSAVGIGMVLAPALGAFPLPF